MTKVFSAGSARSAVSSAEVLVASATTAVAIAIVASYLIFRPGWRVPPAGILVLSIAGGVGTALWLRRGADWSAKALAERWQLADLGALGAVVVAAAALLLWMAWPELLPAGGGPDLTHHLVLVNYIERNWRLVYDPALVPYLGDMIYYTPGSHLLFALAGAWSRSDGLHVVHCVLTLTVALECGFVLCIAQRVLPPDARRTAFAIAAVVLLFRPHEYVIGSFARDSFWAQAVAELFACGAWWALVVWDEQRCRDVMGLFALFGAAAFVTWPVWIGPIVLAAAVVVACRGGLSIREKLAHAAIGLAPIAGVAAIHMWGRLGWLRMAGTSGAVVRPSVALVGWPFAMLAAAGAVLLAVNRRGRATLALVAATLVQAVALWAVARASGADTPYLALKMMYLLPYPLAVAAAFALRVLWSVALGRSRVDRYAGVFVALLAVGVAVRLVAIDWPAPIVTESAYQSGRWARDHVSPACVDYLVADGYTGYWLHLAVLDNPRNTRRVEAAETFEPRDAVARWIETDGLPYAIVDDVNGFSKALFTSTDTLARFGSSAVIRRRGKAICPP